MKKLGKIAIQMGGDISYVDAPEATAPGNEDYVALSSEPKLNTAASV